MGLNANKVAAPKNNKVEQTVLSGSHGARVVQIIDLGIQDGGSYQGTAKPPVHKIQLTYELSHEFMKDEEGVEQTDQPRWINEDFAFHSLEVDLAKSTKRYKVLDPESTFGGDFTLLGGTPCTLAIITNAGKGKHQGKTFSNIANVTGPMNVPGYVQPELVHEVRVFTLDEPDMEVFGALPEWIQDKIKGNFEFKGSKLDVALNGGSGAGGGAPQEPAKADVGDGDMY